MDWKTAYLYPTLRPLIGSVVRAMSRSRLPQLSGIVRLKGLSGPVEILRDRWSVPHIYAASTADAVFAQGYTHAQERLWQMDFTRRVVAGRLSEILGQPGLGADRVMRTLGFRRIAEEEASILSEPVRSLIQSFCDGINAFLENARRFPVEFSLLGYAPEPWQMADILSWTKLMSWTLAGNWASEFLRGQIIARLGEEKARALEIDSADTWAAVLDAAGFDAPHGRIDPSAGYTGSKAGEGVGSNNWVLHGSRTPSGMPLLANDMHMDLTAPGIWYENHLVSPDYEITGLSLPGAPFIISGHNRWLAWGFTDGLPDVQDLYEEHIRTTPEGVTEYEYMGSWHPAQVRREQIEVKGGSPVTHEIVETRHGPLINLLFQDAYPDAPPLALRWTALEPEETFHALYEMNIARSCLEFHQALRRFSGPSQNVVYADNQGSIGYTLPGRIPIRAQGDGSIPVPGWTGEYEWTGWIPFEELPHMLNPKAGYIVTANNVHARGGNPHFIGCDYCSSDRAARITELIEAQPTIDIAYIRKMHYDQVSISARVFARHAGSLETADPELQQLIRQMRGWDGTLAHESTPAAVFQVAIRQALQLVLTHHLGGLAANVQGKGPASGYWGNHSWEWFIHLLDQPSSPWFDLGNGEQRDDVLLQTMARTLDFLKQELGPDPRRWTWGRLHTLTFRHILGGQELLASAFNLGPFPIGGDGTTISASMTSQYDLSHETVVGPAFRYIADLSDLDHCWGVLAPGQSGSPASPAYASGIQPWLNGEYHPMLFRRDEVEQHVTDNLMLEPDS